MTLLAPNKVLVVCHAGAGIGLGHLMRSLVAARALRDCLGFHIVLIVQGTEIDSSLCSEFDHTCLSPSADLIAAITAQVKKTAIQVLLLDLFPMQVPATLAEALTVWRRGGCKVVAIDGLLALRDLLDLIFLPSFRCPPLEPSTSATPVVYGWDCLLLNVDEAPPAGPRGNQVLILTGGSDSTSLGRTWPTLLDRLLPVRSEVHWVTGPFATSPYLPDTRRLTWHEHVAPRDLRHLMSRANFAVTVFGVSFFELLHYGVATVVFSPYGLKDRSELDAISSSGLALVADDHFDATTRLLELMNNENLAMELSAQASARFSVAGTKRLCSEVEALIAC